jgi:tetratricopeptide (TPR) repeat protein
MDEAEENNLDAHAMQPRWDRWHTCSLCEQGYHGVVCCALGWACWKTYVGRPEADQFRGMAMNLLGLGLDAADHDEDALSVKETELSMRRRLGAPATIILAAQNNLAMTYQLLGRLEDTLPLRQEVYAGRLQLNGEEHESSLIAANNYADTLKDLRRFEEAKSLLRKTIPVARRVLGDSDRLMLKMRSMYAQALYGDPAATLDELREAVTTLEETYRTARRVLGGAHPTVSGIEDDLQNARAMLVESLRAAVEAMTPGDA